MRTALPAVLLLATNAAALELSYFEQSGKACVWKHAARPDDRSPRELARFEVPCAGVSIAWRPGGARALVRFADPVQLFEVDPGTKERTALPLPPHGDFDEAGYDSKGRIVALTIQDFPDRASEVVFDGSRYRAGDHTGWPALAHAWTFEHGRWTRLETKVTGTSACMAPHTRVLAAYSEIVRPDGADSRDVTDGEKHRLELLWPASPDPSGEWRRVGDVFVWHTAMGEYLRPTGHLALESSGRLQLVETGFTAEDSIDLDVRRDVLLVSQPWQRPARARVIELGSGRVVFSASDVHAIELR